MKVEDKNIIGHITSIAVLDEHRKKGIAIKLMLSALVAMKKHKYKPSVVQLHVRESNKIAIHIYADRLNYKKISKIEKYYSNPVEAAWLMERQI